MIPALLSAYAVPDMATFTANCEPTHNALNGASVLPGANIMEWAGTIDTAVPLPQNGALLSAACGSAIRPFVGNHIAYTNYDIGRFLIGSTMVPTGTDFLRLAFSGTSVALTNVGSQQLFPDIIVSDPNTIYNPSTGTVTIKNAGKYSLTASCIPSTTAGNFWIGVDVNGSFFTVGGESVISAPAVPSVHAEAWFDAGDTLQVWVNNTLAGATLSSASFGTYFSLAKVG